MKHRIKNTLRGMSQHLGIKVKFVDYFADDVHGKLLPREKRILINARKSRNEHLFTLLHELGHYLIHFKNSPKKHHPRFLEFNWKNDWLLNLCSKIRRSMRYYFNSTNGKEFEADLWAFGAFIYFVKHLGCRNDLLTFLDRHPEKSRAFLIAALGVTVSDIKTRIRKIATILLAPVITL